MKKVVEELKERIAHNNQRAQIFSIINLFDGLPKAAFIRAHPNFMRHPTPLGYGRMRWQQQQQQQAQSLKITKRRYTWLIVEAREGSKWKSAVIVPLATLGQTQHGPVGSITWAFYAFFNSLDFTWWLVINICSVSATDLHLLCPPLWPADTLTLSATHLTSCSCWSLVSKLIVHFVSRVHWYKYRI